MVKLIGISSYDCEDAIQRLDDYVDRELTPYEMRSIKAHLFLCRHCAHRFRFEASLIREIRDKLQRIDAPGDLMEKVTLALAQGQGCET